jgi:transposase
VDTELSNYYLIPKGGVHLKKQRRHYTKEFKTEAIKLVESRGGNASSVARKLGILPGTLNRWMREYKDDQEYAFPGLGNLKEPDKELYELRRELADAKMERDILKKALAIFSKPSQ